MYALPKFDCLLTVEDFARHVGAAFRVEATPTEIEVRLDAIERFTRTAINHRDPFTLVFSTPFAALLVAGAYRMRAPGGRMFEIDLIPTQTAFGPRRSYHAVFA